MPSHALDPSVFRFTVRAPEARYAALKKAALRVGMDPGALVQALFDRLDLTVPVQLLAQPVYFLHPEETAKELQERAAAAGLTAKELKVLRALAAAADRDHFVRPVANDVSATTMVPADALEEVYDRLVEKGFLAVRDSRRRKRCYRVTRLPE